MISFFTILICSDSPGWNDSPTTPFSFTPTQSWVTKLPKQTWPTNSPSWPPTRSPFTSQTSDSKTTSNSSDDQHDAGDSTWEKHKVLILSISCSAAGVIIITIITVIVVLRIKRKKEISSVFMEPILAPNVDII